MTKPACNAAASSRSSPGELVLGRTRVEPVPLKGYGLVAAERMAAFDVIEENLCLVLDAADSAAANTTRLRHYVYFWDDESGADELALAMGNLSFCNHSPQPNATIERDRPRGTLALRSRVPIEAGTEITIDYEYPLDFTVHE